MKRLLALAASAIALSATPVAAQDFVIANATLALGDGSEPIADGVVIVDDGVVVYAGKPDGRTYETDMVIDAGDAWVTPGIFASVTTLGLSDVGAVSESNDTSARGAPFSAALDVAPIVNPYSQDMLVSRAGGITRAATTTLPSGSIFGGQGAIIDLDSDANPIVESKAFQLVALGERGASLSGGSRASAFVLLRQALYEAQGLRGTTTGTPQMTEIEKDGDLFLGRFDAHALIPVLSGSQKLYVAVDRVADIRAALALKGEFARLDMVLVGAGEGWLVADEIAASGVPVIADALDDLPVTFEVLAATQSNVGRMMRAGVKVAISANSATNPRNMTQAAGNLVALGKLPGAAGLSWGQAFAAISSVPAAVNGFDGKGGVLKPGAWGDVVMWDGDPLEVGSVPTRVFIGGVEQSLENHQSGLRDRYRDLDESDLPKAYDW